MIKTRISQIREQVACWPLSARLSYGKAANRLQEELGMAWDEAEIRAFKAVNDRLVELRRKNPQADLGFVKVKETPDPYLPNPDDLPMEPGGYGRGPYLYDNESYRASLEYDRVHSSLLTAPKEPKKHKGFAAPAIIAGPDPNPSLPAVTPAVKLAPVKKIKGDVGIYEESKAVAKKGRARNKHKPDKNATSFLENSDD